jgi:hypothetical protein
MRRLAQATVLLALGCAPGTNAARSCAGERVLECDPYEWAVVTAGALEPAEIPIGDPRVRAHFTVTLGTCGASTPVAPTVQVQALLGAADGGPPTAVADLTTITASSPTSTTIDVTVDNPFTAAGGVPPSSNVTLRFVPVVGGCDGDALEVPYRTGPLVMP